MVIGSIAVYDLIKLSSNSESSVDPIYVSWIQFLLNPVWHDVWKQCSSLESPRGNFYKTQWARQGVNFHLQKSLEIEKTSADKIWSKKDKGI